jgi:peroxiredoxin
MITRSINFALAFLLFLALPSLGQQAPLKIDVSRLGPQAGQVVPDFHLPDAQGKVWTRDSIMGPKGAMVVFSRSVDWCPYCKTQVIELQSRLGELKAQGLGLAVITYDSPAIMADFSRRRGVTFPLLSDPGSQTIKAYGILNTTVAAGTSNYGIPFPGTFLIDRTGKVTSRFFEEAYQERNGRQPDPDDKGPAVSRIGDLRLQAARRACAGVSEAVSTRAKHGRQHDARRQSRAQRRRYRDDCGHARISSVRRSTVFYAAFDSRVLHRQVAATGHRTRERAEMKPWADVKHFEGERHQGERRPDDLLQRRRHPDRERRNPDI